MVTVVRANDLSGMQLGRANSGRVDVLEQLPSALGKQTSPLAGNWIVGCPSENVWVRKADDRGLLCMQV